MNIKALYVHNAVLILCFSLKLETIAKKKIYFNFFSLSVLQVYEMFVAGYQFQVLSPIFTCHWGLQTVKSRPSWRERQNDANRKVFEVFKREVFARYHKDPLKMVLPKKGNNNNNKQQNGNH